MYIIYLWYLYHAIPTTVWRTVKWHCTGKMCQVHVLLEKTTCPYILFAPQILFYIDLFQVNHCRLKSVWQIFNSCSRHALHLYILSPKSSKSDHFYYWNMLKPMVTWESTILRKPHIFRFRIMDLFSLPRGVADWWKAAIGCWSTPHLMAWASGRRNNSSKALRLPMSFACKRY